MLEQIAGRCVHFTGLLKDECRAGVRYVDVRDPDARPYRLPCFREDLFGTGHPAPTCTSQRFPTEEEAAAEEREHREAIDRALAANRAGKCHVCGADIEPSHVVGRCKYASCGHRVGQIASADR